MLSKSFGKIICNGGTGGGITSGVGIGGTASGGSFVNNNGLDGLFNTASNGGIIDLATRWWDNLVYDDLSLTRAIDGASATKKGNGGAGQSAGARGGGGAGASIGLVDVSLGNHYVKVGKKGLAGRSNGEDGVVIIEYL